jgi:hypothetical protein
LLGSVPDLRQRLPGPAKKASQDALHIAVDDGAGFVKSDAGDGRRGVTPDAGKRAQGAGGGGQPAGVIAHQAARGIMQGASAAVVAKSAPGGEHFGGLGGGKRGHVGKAAQKIAVTVQHRTHSRLLQHDFGNPDVVRVAGGTPGQRAAPAGKPA